MEMRSSDPMIHTRVPSVANRPRAAVRVLGTGAQPTAMQDLTAIVTALATETGLQSAVAKLQRDAARILHLRDALCFWIDWPHRIAWTISGRVSHELEETVIEAAGSGKRNTLAGAVIEPVGPVPARAVLALRKPSGLAFSPHELVVIQTLATSIAPALDKLIRAR
jgi:hypothetical protein